MRYICRCTQRKQDISELVAPAITRENALDGHFLWFFKRSVRFR